jgi:hypothetical protein
MISAALVEAIARAVEAQGGDLSDVEDLVTVWESVQRRNAERADLIRGQVRRSVETEERRA